MAATITVTGLNEALREVSDIATNLKPQAQEFVHKLGEIAKDTAQSAYAPWDVTVENIPSKRGVSSTVKATSNEDLKSHDGEVIGSLILIAEFGAGLLAGSHPWSTDVPDVYPGSYSEKYGTGEYAETGAWHWAGRQWVYVAPTYAMYQGSQEAENSAQSVINEVFK